MSDYDHPGYWMKCSSCELPKAHPHEVFGLCKDCRIIEIRQKFINVFLDRDSNQKIEKSIQEFKDLLLLMGFRG